MYIAWIRYTYALVCNRPCKCPNTTLFCWGCCCVTLRTSPSFTSLKANPAGITFESAHNQDHASFSHVKLKAAEAELAKLKNTAQTMQEDTQYCGSGPQRSG